MKNTPDIYADTPVVNTAYMIAVMQAHADGKRVQIAPKPILIASPYRWSPPDMVIDPVWQWASYCYRVHPDAKPKPPKIKVPFTQENFPVGTVWVRRPGVDRMTYRLVTALVDSGATAGVALSFETLCYYYEYSLDRRTWFPCYTEVDAPESQSQPARPVQ